MSENTNNKSQENEKVVVKAEVLTEDENESEPTPENNENAKNEEKFKVEVKKVNEEKKKDKEKESSTKAKKKTPLILIIIIILLIGALLIVYFLPKNNKSKGKVSEEVKKVSSPYQMSGNSLEDFDLSFLQMENSDTNIVYSPLSIKYALAMLSEGAKGKTKEEIDAVVGKYLANKYTNSANMSFANALFVRDAYKDNVKENYITKLQSKYNAEVIFDTFENTTTLNNWVQDKTFGMINGLFDDVSDLDFVLANALAIDMEWVKRIQPDQGKDRPYSVKYNHEDYSLYVDAIGMDMYDTLKFNNSIDAKSVKVAASINNYDIVKDLGEDNIRNTITSEYTSWLNDGGCGDNDLEVGPFVDKFISELNANYQKSSSSTDFQLYENDEVKSFAKDLKQYDGLTLQYVGIMPKTTDINEFIKNTNAKEIGSIINNLKTLEPANFNQGKLIEITGSIPLFNFKYELNLMNDLKQLGIKQVFDDGKADLSNLTNKNAYIAKASHKANIEFSNDGIKAAAATGVGGLGATGCWFEHLYEVPVEKIDITFDKPYIFLIRDKESGEIWFTGKVVAPTNN